MDNDANASTACVQCPPGTAVTVDKTVGACSLYACPAGTSDTDSDPTTACVACGAGNQATTTGLSGACVPCPAGWTDLDSNSATGCLQCEAGSVVTAPGHAGLCDLCPKGTTDHDRNPATACYVCGAGHEEIEEGLSGPCKLCDYGYTDDDRDSKTACVKCPGRVGSSTQGNIGTCSELVCPIGKTDADDNPASACESCPTGTDLSESGLVGTCADHVCMAGTTDHDSDPKTACFECGPGFFIPLNGSFGPCSKFICAAGRTDADLDPTTACVVCEPGTGLPSTASTGPCADYTCAAGTTDHDSKASTACAVCGAGGYVPSSSVGACATFACGAETVDADLDASTPCVAAITCKAGEMQQTAPTTTSQRVCASCVLGESFKPAAGSDGCTATTRCTETLYMTKQPTLTTDRTCVPLSPSCAPGTEWETRAPSATADRVCKPLSNVTLYLRVPYTDFAGTLQLRTTLESNVRAGALNISNVETAAAIVRVLFFPFVNGTSQIAAVVQVLAENANAVYYLQEALDNGLFAIKLSNGKTIVAASEGTYLAPSSGTSASQSSSASVGLAPIAGAFAGAIVLVIIVAAVIVRRRRQQQDQNSTNVASLSHSNPTFGSPSMSMKQRASWASGSAHYASSSFGAGAGNHAMYGDDNLFGDDDQTYYDSGFLTAQTPAGGAAGYLDVKPSSAAGYVDVRPTYQTNVNNHGDVDLYEERNPMPNGGSDAYIYNIAADGDGGVFGFGAQTAETNEYVETGPAEKSSETKNAPASGAAKSMFGRRLPASIRVDKPEKRGPPAFQKEGDFGFGFGDEKPVGDYFFPEAPEVDGTYILTK